nr:NAD(P)H-dependent oxidoreductase [Candidatus Gracilibacteria bacterium]
MSNIIEALNWRYATKVFDKTKKVSKEDLDEIIESFILTASSYGVQPWKLLVIENQDVKNSLLEASYGQAQVTDCSHLLVLCRLTNIGNSHIDKYMDSTSKIRGIPRESLSGFENLVKGFIGSLDETTKSKWAGNQVYIALGNLLTVLAMKKIDSCPMEGFVPSKYDEILNLKEKGLASVLVLPIGYRSEEDKYANLKKVRFDMGEVVEIID